MSIPCLCRKWQKNSIRKKAMKVALLSYGALTPRMRWMTKDLIYNSTRSSNLPPNAFWSILNLHNTMKKYFSATIIYRDKVSHQDVIAQTFKTTSSYFVHWVLHVFSIIADLITVRIRTHTWEAQSGTLPFPRKPCTHAGGGAGKDLGIHLSQASRKTCAALPKVTYS